MTSVNETNAVIRERERCSEAVKALLAIATVSDGTKEGDLVTKGDVLKIINNHE